MTAAYNRATVTLLLVTAIAVPMLFAPDAGAGKNNDDQALDRTPEPTTQEKAKQLAVEVQPVSSFDLPPRSIDDILRVLQRYAAETTPSQEQHRQRAAQTTAAAGQTTAQFLVLRSRANRQLGRYRQGIADATAALQTAKGGDVAEANIALYNLHEELGDLDTALLFAEHAVGTATNDTQRYLARLLFSVGLSFSGRLDAAAAQIEILSSFHPSRRNSGKFANFLRSLAYSTRAYNQFYRGDYAAARTLLLEGIALNESDLEHHRNVVSNSGNRLEDHSQRVRTVLMRFVALTLLREGRVSEAESLAREVVHIQAAHFGSSSGQTAEGLGTLTEILAEQGRAADSARLARATLDVYDRMGADTDSTTRAAVRRTLGDALVAAGDWRAALDEYDAIQQDLKRPDDILQLFQFNLTWAMPSIELGHAATALERLRTIRARLAENIGADRYETAEADGFVASANLVLGDTQLALDGFRDAVPTLLQRTNQSDAEDQTGSNRMLRLRFILEHYLEALADNATPASIEEAFRIANAIRGGRVDEALAAAAARATLGSPELAELARNEQDALLRIKALNGLLARSGGQGPTDRQVRDELLAQIRTQTESRRSALAAITQRAPAYAQIIDPQPTDVATARTALRDGEALLTTYTTPRRTHVWVVRTTGAVRHAAVELPRVELARIVANLRHALEPDAETLADLPAFDVDLAYSLYGRLLVPVEDAWREAGNLVIVPHGALATLPLALLPTSPSARITDTSLLFDGYRAVPWLVRSHAVSTLPSVASLLALRADARTAAGKRPFVGFGDPVFDPNDRAAPLLAGRSFRSTLRAAANTRTVDSAQIGMLPRLPDTADEILSVARAMGADLETDVFLELDANEGTVKALSTNGRLDDYRVVSFATHGLMAGDLDGLTQPALALSNPLLAAAGGDGLLDMTEILGLRMNADWAVLSACNTAAADGAGAEAVSGLGRAFFYAGTRALLVSNWPVHSAATTYLMTDLFSRYAGDPSRQRAESLRQAILQTINDGVFAQQGEPLFSYAHPLFWAPFSLVGDGG